jgi:hypothetical protein
MPFEVTDCLPSPDTALFNRLLYYHLYVNKKISLADRSIKRHSRGSKECSGGRYSRQALDSLFLTVSQRFVSRILFVSCRG